MSRKDGVYYLEAPVVLEDATVTVGAGIGSAVYPDHGDDADQLMQRAEHGPRRRSRARGDADLRSQNAPCSVATTSRVSQIARKRPRSGARTFEAHGQNRRF